MSETPSNPPETTNDASEKVPEGEAKAETESDHATHLSTHVSTHLSLRSTVIVLTLAAAGAVGFFIAGRLSLPPVESHPDGKGSLEVKAPLPPLNTFPEVSFAQQGEDLVIKNLFAQIGIPDATYLDVGAHDPMRGSNTYLFYALNSKGVVVEPNPLFVAKLKAVRPRDVVIDKGIGVGGAKIGKYFEFIGDGQTNTFSEEQVKRLEGLGVKPAQVSEMPLIGINDVLASSFPKKAPSLLSIDTQGSELAILKELDFSRWKPPIICANTLAIDTGLPIVEITTFLASKGYTVRGGSYAKTIYVSDEAFARARDAGLRGVH